LRCLVEGRGLGERMPGLDVRSNRTHKEEFYYRLASTTSLAQVNKLLRRWEDVHNCYRPHQGLGQLMPLAFHQKCA
jgi:transposase InsO family protein